ncbi:ketosteroid isomerase-like protein [Kineosphaera limosa]|uniref:SnoaL-like domain-containing protein n=1 Tax=Kineosphaera limosa NBRC 100340 TaxID=1184609 RepID=K6XEW5_9MICO|nr:nuclear transport factor 2 family protein [Kineosphaera limosa]NYE01788.1 ketosteroid isomerase-like protein [Kineosphaera limosa]GAB97339.1 hypothetical protein KILIM_065_00160 [Kineosphaera limosa NBRC 100340]
MLGDSRTHGPDLRRAVQGYYDALDADDMESVLEFFSGDVLYQRPGYQRMVGIDDVRRYYEQGRLIAPGRHVLRTLVVEGNNVAAHGEYEGDLKEGGRRTVGFAAFFVFDGNGRAAEHTTYFFTPSV